MNYHKIFHDDLTNGEGVRTTLFVSGCDHGCKGCYNKATWNPKSGTPFTEETLSELFKGLDKPYVSGLSLTGGDPLHRRNLYGIQRLLKLLREKYGNTKNVWMWTGYALEELDDDTDQMNQVRREIVSQVDVLVDGKYIEEMKSPQLPFRGSSNQIIHRMR